MKIAEISRGFVRNIIEADELPRPTLTSYFVDVSGLDVTPELHWKYIHAENRFIAPDEDHEEVGSEYYRNRRWADLLNDRNILLAESDWTVLPDSPLSFIEKMKWKRYRKELRDFPETYAGREPEYLDLPTDPSKRIGLPFFEKVKQSIAVFIAELKDA